MSMFARISALAGRNISPSVGTAVEAVDFVRGNSEIHRLALKFNISLALRATYTLAWNGRSRCGECPPARSGRSRATRRVEAASGAGGGESHSQPVSTFRAPAVIPVNSERARPPRSPGDDVSRAHGARRRERLVTPPAPRERGAQRGLREPCGIEDPAGSRRDTPATKRTKAGESQSA